MIFSIRNINRSEYLDLDSIKEVMYDATLYSSSELIELAKSFEKTRIVYDLTRVTDVQEILSDIKDLPQVIDGMVFRVSRLDDLSLLLDSKLPVFCGPNDASNADSLDKMRILCEKGVTDVYVSGQLAFEMRNVRLLADRFNVKVRIIPNIASLSGFTFSHIGIEDNLTAFWVRPNDLCLYEPYVDIVEFYGNDNKQSVFYDIYANDKEWLGELGDIVVGLYKVNNRGLLRDFTGARLNCGKKCLLDRCHSCFRYKILANAIAENKLRVEV